MLNLKVVSGCQGGRLIKAVAADTCPRAPHGLAKLIDYISNYTS